MEHNHAEDNAIPCQIISNSVKRKAAENICEKIAKLIRQEISKNVNVGAGLRAEDLKNGGVRGSGPLP